MDDKVVWAIWVLGAYLIGGIPFGFIIGKMRGVDVRTVGSKNIGATNVYRTVGHKWGFLAFFCDFLKGLLPTLAAIHWMPTGLDPVYVGLACVIGHTLTPYMKFKGGKGVATAFSMLRPFLPNFRTGLSRSKKVPSSAGAASSASLQPFDVRRKPWLRR